MQTDKTGWTLRGFFKAFPGSSRPVGDTSNKLAVYGIDDGSSIHKTDAHTLRWASEFSQRENYHLQAWLAISFLNGGGRQSAATGTGGGDNITLV